LECLAAGCLEFSNTDCVTEENLDLAAFAKFIQASSIHPDYHLLTAENTAKLQKGFKFSLTVNEPEDIKNKII
jgi:glycerophosphoryl diester phosphodiesterase